MTWGPDEWDRWLAHRDGAQPPPPGTVVEIERWIARLPDKHCRTVADLGCGLGSRLPLLAARFGRVIAVDYAPAGMARATTARAMLLDDGATPAPNEFHEIELQYRLQRAGLRGASIRRIKDRGNGEQLICRAVRRADN